MRYNSFLFFAITLALGVVSSFSVCGQTPPCGNNAPNTAGNGTPSNPSAGDPFVMYTGNEYREITDLTVWGGVGDYHLTWGRWANSRFVSGATNFGDGHGWRNNYQWEMANAPISSGGKAQMEIVYPEGFDYLFAQDTPTSTTWHPPTTVPDLLSKTGTDYYLQRQNGFVYHFTTNVDSSGNTYYLMTDFRDVHQNDYVVNYNSAHQVTEITEPGGRNIQVNYTIVNLSTIDFTTFATVSTVPTAAAYTTMTVTDPHAYRYLRYLSADGGYGGVAEVAFFDTSGNQINGTPFGSGPAAHPGYEYTKVFDGNTSTYVWYPQASGGYVGLDLGAGNSKVVGSVRFYPTSNPHAMCGYSPTNSSNFGQFQGSNVAATPLSVVSSVSSSDGRTITYNYSTYNDAHLPYVYQTLSSVSYDDGTQATYSYGQAMPTTRPLVTNWSDPRYKLPFVVSESSYYSSVGSALGEIQAQLNPVSNQAVYSLGAYGPSLHTPSVTDGAGNMRMNVMYSTNGRVVTMTDALSQSVSVGYNSNGYIQSEEDPRGYTVNYTTSSFANPVQISFPDSSIQKWTRDNLDLPLTHTDELGHVTTMTRDGSHRITAIAYPDLSSEAYTYNSFGQTLSHTLRNGHVESATYDGTGLNTSAVDAAGHTATFTHDTAGRLASTTDANGHMTSYQYDARGHITQITYADGTTHSFSYDQFGDKLTDVDELGHTTNYTYDTYKRCTSITDALGRSTQYIFRPNYYLKKPDKVIFPSGKVTYNTYDPNGHLLTETVGYGTADAATTSYVYDGAYNVTSMTDPKGHLWKFSYDNRNRKISQTDPLNDQTLYGYDAASNLHTITRPNGGVTTNNYDAMHRLLSTTDPKSETTTHTYDASGNMLTTVDARGHTYTYSYDALNRKTSIKYPDNSTELYGYDAVGNVVSYTTRAGQTKTSVFDSRNREISYTWSDGVTPGVARGYDAAGRLVSSANGTSTSTYGYDSGNQMLSETQINAAAGVSWEVSYTYDPDGNRSTVTYPSGTVVAYGYTNRNKLNSISTNGSTTATYSYDSNDNILSKSMVDASLASYTYDSDNRLTTLNHTMSGTSFARFDYGYDNVNRRTYEQRDSGTGDVFSYDAIDQVSGVNYDATNPTSSTSGADRTVGYSYDASGNRTALSDSVNGSQTYTTNANNQYTAINGVTYGYDGNGNLIGGNGTYLYDAQNRLGTAQVGGNTDQFYYDTKNRVVQREVNGTPMYFVYDGWDLIEERDSSNNVLATYVHGVRQDELLTRTTVSGTIYYHHNSLGSVANLTNSSGVVVEKYKYDVYGKASITDGSGNPLSATAYGNRFMFTGREYLAEVNLYDFRNRVYSTDLGRFLQTDPIRFSGGDINIYRYCGNSPINFNDQAGLWDVSDTLEAVGTAALIGAAIAGSPIALGALAVVGTAAAAVETYDAASGLVNSANNYGDALQNEVNSTPDNLAQNAQNAQAALTPALQDAVNTALTVPGTSFTGPVDTPEFSGEKPTGNEIKDAIDDAGLDKIKDAIKDKAKDQIPNGNDPKDDDDDDDGDCPDDGD